MLGTPVKERQKPVFSRHPKKPAEFPEHWAQYSVIQGQHKLLSAPKDNRVELYNLIKDPYESDNLATKQEKKVAELEALLKTWLTTLPEAPKGNVFSSLRQ